MLFLVRLTPVGDALWNASWTHQIAATPQEAARILVEEERAYLAREKISVRAAVVSLGPSPIPEAWLQDLLLGVNVSQAELTTLRDMPILSVWEEDDNGKFVLTDDPEIRVEARRQHELLLAL